MKRDFESTRRDGLITSTPARYCLVDNTYSRCGGSSRAFAMTRAASREALVCELDRFKDERVISRWMSPYGGAGTCELS